MTTYYNFIPARLPSQIDGLVLWLKSDAGITKDGADRVSEWADQSGNGNDVTQATDDNKPVWTDNQLNSHPVIVFDGNNDVLLGDTIVTSRSVSVFMVVKANNLSGNTQQIFNNGTHSVNGFGSYVAGNSPPKIHVQYGGADDFNICPFSSEFELWDFRTKIEGGSHTDFYQNGDNKFSDSGSCFVSSGGQLSVGDYNSSFPLDGAIAEIIIYDAYLDDTDRQKIENYLRGRYRIY